MNRKELGQFGERVVAHALEQRGFCIVERNVHVQWGEIDILVRKGSVLYIVEVKTRRTDMYGSAWEQFTREKFLKVRRAGSLWCRENWRGQREYVFAAVTVKAGKAHIEWFWNVGLQDFV